MRQEDVVVPESRDVRGTLDAPDGDADAAVVACPPHPQFGGNRSDRRLQAVAGSLVDRGVATLRFDYGEWDGGDGERDDVAAALRWAGDRYDRVGLFGYSFGAATSLLVADGRDDLAALSVLAPDAKAVGALDGVTCPLQVLYGTRDDTVDWAPVVERARELNDAGRDPPVDVVECSADHHFVGQDGKVARAVGGFLEEYLGDG
jgi:alpha/beta superfamily hydrolase